MSRTRLDPVQRILNRVDGPLAENECWITNGHHDKDGYSKIWVHPTYKGSHRVMWEVWNGEPVPDGLSVLHSCDNPACVNPHHLSVGTTLENHRQRGERGRTARWSNHGRSKLTEEDVKIIKERLKTENNCAKIARDFGVHRTTIYHIRDGLVWRLNKDVN